MTWQNKTFTKKQLDEMGEDGVETKRQQNVQRALHEIQNEVLYNARQGRKNCSFSITRTKIEQQVDYFPILVEEVKKMFPDSEVNYTMISGIWDVCHTIKINWV